MPQAPFPPNEARRLAAVQRLRMVGTPAEERFDKITRLAKRMFNVPVVLIDILDDKKVWLKSAQGVDILQTPREESYCQYGILGDHEVCYIPDALLDTRVFDSPSASIFRFYTGQPLHFEGECVGVICLADFTPRSLTDEDFSALRDLANLVEQEFDVGALSKLQVDMAAENEALTRKALIDPLTRIWNRGAIFDITSRELDAAQQEGSSLGVILLDLDHFKVINDTYGHPAGDEVLRRISERLRQTVRPSDAVGRWGGEEFLCVLPDCSEKNLPDVAERIRLSICQEPVSFEGTEIKVTASLGATLSVAGSQLVDLLVKAADEGLYQSKRGGRNQCCIRRVTHSFLMKAVRA